MDIDFNYIKLVFTDYHYNSQLSFILKSKTYRQILYNIKYKKIDTIMLLCSRAKRLLQNGKYYDNQMFDIDIINKKVVIKNRI